MPPIPIRNGRFYTESDRQWDDPDQGDVVTTHTYAKRYRSDPNITMALMCMDIGTGERTIGIKASTEDIDLDSFQSRVSIWGDGKMTSGGCTWLETESSNPNIKSGVFRTTRRSAKSGEIKFDKPFPSTPTVLVWLSGFQMGNDGDWDVGGWAESVTPDGFTLEVRTGEDTALNQSTLSWMAFVESANIRGGRECDIDLASKDGGGNSQHYIYPVLDFETPFEKKPEAAIGISRVRASGAGMRINCSVPEVETDWIKYEVGTWAHCTIEAADLSWIAVA